MIFFYITLFLLNLFVFLNFNSFKNKLIQDIPDKKRKNHKNNTPLFGGVLLITNFIIYEIFFIFFYKDTFENELFLFYFRELLIFNIYIFGIFFIGLYDEKYNLSASTKTILLVSIITFATHYSGDFKLDSIDIKSLNINVWLGDFSKIITIICIFFYINALNLYDGVNMQIGLYFLIIFIFFIIKSALISLSISLIIALIFFLILNSKSKAFMGDSGVYFVASLIGYEFIKNYNKHLIVSEEIILLTFAPIIDAIRLFFLRILKRKNPFLGDTNHIHHYLILSIGKSKTIITTFFLTLVPISIYLAGLLSFKIIIILQIFFYFVMISNYTNRLFRTFFFLFYKIK
jgi:UDP-N-acetylmuramyl pentapeptide phosphotransferase/UDP-N-acetylglucosamine-1-phosphate transferase